MKYLIEIRIQKNDVTRTVTGYVDNDSTATFNAATDEMIDLIKLHEPDWEILDIKQFA